MPFGAFTKTFFAIKDGSIPKHTNAYNG